VLHIREKVYLNQKTSHEIAPALLCWIALQHPMMIIIIEKEASIVESRSRDIDLR